MTRPDDGAVRPGVVWFGEALPADAWTAAEHAATAAAALPALAAALA